MPCSPNLHVGSTGNFIIRHILGSPAGPFLEPIRSFSARWMRGWQEAIRRNFVTSSRSFLKTPLHPFFCKLFCIPKKGFLSEFIIGRRFYCMGSRAWRGRGWGDRVTVTRALWASPVRIVNCPYSESSHNYIQLLSVLWQQLQHYNTVRTLKATTITVTVLTVTTATTAMLPLGNPDLPHTCDGDVPPAWVTPAPPETIKKQAPENPISGYKDSPSGSLARKAMGRSLIASSSKGHFSFVIVPQKRQYKFSFQKALRRKNYIGTYIPLKQTQKKAKRSPKKIGPLHE